MTATSTIDFKSLVKPMKITQTGSVLRSTLLTLAAIIVVLGLISTQLPKAFKDDLSRVGAGANTAVLIHNKNGVQSLDFMSLVDRVRSDFEDQVEFLIADVDTDSGRKFMQTQQIGDIGLALFSPDGTRLRVVAATLDEEALRTALDSAFAKVP